MTRIEENERQYRVTDQMITMHAALRDRYRRRALLISTVLLAGSVCLNGLVFAGDSLFRQFGLNVNFARDGIAFISILLLAASIVESRVDWGGRSRLHEDAVQKLSQLKAKYRTQHSNPETDDASLDTLSQDYAQTMPQLTPIPEKYHNILKALHKFKRLESAAIDRHPTAPVFLIRLCLRLHGARSIVCETIKSNKES